MRLLKALVCAAALTAFLAPPAHADDWNKLTYFTFSGPVQLPGVTLPGGTYAFKLADVLGDRHVVQVFSKDQKQIYATLLAIPSDRINPANKPIVMFAETPVGQPAAVKSWFYPGDTIGDEFVYPKAQAMKIAKATHQRVLATAENVPANEPKAMKGAKLGRVDENGNMAPENEKAENNANASQPATTATTGTTATTAKNEPSTSGNAVTNAAKKAGHATKHAARVAKNAVTGKKANASANNTNNAVGTSGQQAAHRRARHLPKTASSLELFELLSALSLGGAFGIRRLRTRFAETR